MQVTKAGARSTALLAVGVTVAATTVASATKGDVPPLTMLIGAIILIILLFVLSQFVPDLAGAFAILILLSGLIANGEALGNALSRSTSQERSYPNG